MEKKYIKAALDNKPFRPFLMGITDGTEITIKDREYAHVAPGSGQTVIVFKDNGGFHLVEIASVREILYLDTL